MFILSVTLLLITINVTIFFSHKYSRGFKKMLKMSVALNQLLLMSDYKPVVPVGGCDNVLKSLNPAAHAHLQGTEVTR